MQTDTIFNAQLNFLFIPSWVQKAVQRATSHLNAVLSINDLHDLVSTMDIAGVYALNVEMGKMIGDLSGEQTIKNLWGNNSIFLHTVEPLCPMAFTEVKDRLFDVNLKDAGQPNPFTLVELSKGVLGVVIYPGYFCGTGLDEHIRLLRFELLRRFRSREDSDHVAKRALFKAYVQSLRLPA